MIQKFKILACIFLTSLFLFACKSSVQTDSPPMSMDEFAEIYVQAVILSQSTDSLQARAEVDSLLSARGISLADMEKIVTHYEQDQEEWRLFWALVVKKLEDATSAAAVTDSVTSSLK